MRPAMKAHYRKDARNEITEVCILCGTKLGISKEMNIHNRKWFIEGAGQLCEACFIDIERDDLKKKNSRCLPDVGRTLVMMR